MGNMCQEISELAKKIKYGVIGDVVYIGSRIEQANNLMPIFDLAFLYMWLPEDLLTQVHRKSQRT